MPDPVIPTLDPEFWQNPYPILDELQRRHRTVYTDTGQFSLLHWDDAEWALKGRDFINEGIERLENRGFKPGDALHTWRSHALGIMEGPDHVRVRRLVAAAMSRQSMEPLRPLIRDHAHSLIDTFPDAGTIDALSGFTSQLPRRVMMDFLGVDADEVRGAEDPLSAARIPDCFGPRVTQDMRNTANEAIQLAMDHVAGLYERRRKEPRDDLLTHLLRAEDEAGKLSHAELITLFSTIFGSGSTTASTLAAGLLELATHPEQAQLLREDPERWKRGACEETLRMHPGIVEMPQRAARDFEAFGRPFSKGDTISIPFGAVNRDPTRWTNPQQFDITRDPEVYSLSFGIGAHFCLGQAMARYTIEEALAAFAERVTSFELVGTPRWAAFVMENRLQDLAIKVQTR